MKNIKVAIIGSEAAMWYRNKIGEHFEVIDNQQLTYYDLPNSTKIIFKSDCKKVK